MHRFRTTWLAACSLLLCRAGLAQAPAPGQIVTYVEAPAAKTPALVTDLKAYAIEVEKGDGSPRVTLLTELGRPSRMVVLEQWPDISSPAETQAQKLLLRKTEPDVLAPIDGHLNHPLTPALSQAPSTAFHVLMHVDVRLGSDAESILKAQRAAVLAAPGALGFEVGVQDQRPNHFTLHEVWANRKAYEAYAATPPAEDLRRRLAPLLGSPFDERFYSKIPR